MISIEAREKMLEYLKTGYGEDFAAGYVHIRESDAAQGLLFATIAWPVANPEIRFQVFYNAREESFTEYYYRACVAYRARPQILAAFEQETGLQCSDVEALQLSMPAECLVEKSQSLEDLLQLYPGEVSLTLRVFVASSQSGFAAGACTDGMERFVERYVKPTGFSYLTLRVFFMEAERIAAYRESVMEPVPDTPPAADIVADFWLVQKTTEISRQDLEAALRIGGEGKWR